MNVPWVFLSTLLLIVSHHDSSSLKNDRGGPHHAGPFNTAPNFIRNSRRIELNEYLVPPPPPRAQSLRSGRVVNPTEAPGYFSKLMNWLNPFNFGAPPPPIETPFQARGPPQFNLHPPLYPPLGPPSQHPLGVHPGPPPPVYTAPSVPAVRPNPGYIAVKGKSCNPCNKIPWIPMQGSGLRSEDLHYLPPGPISHDNQHSASHEVGVPNFSQGPALYHPVPPIPHPESTFLTASQLQNTEINGNLNVHENGDLASSGTQTDGAQLSAVPQSYSSGPSGQQNQDGVRYSDAQNLGPMPTFASGDLTPSVVEDSKDFVHFEESPLVDLSEKDEAHSDAKWPTSTEETLRTTDYVYFEDSSNFIRQGESYSLADIRNINGALETTPSVEASTVAGPYRGNGEQGLSWGNLRNESGDGEKLEEAGRRQPSVKRNKQVQVVIPYTSEYTPIPFQQSYGDWSVKTNFDRTQPRKVPPSSGNNIDNYVQQESRNDIQIINNLQSLLSNKSSTQSARTPLQNNNTRSVVSKVNNSIDVRRLQKNIDNWTIQEYSKATTSNTVLPSSPHPYLLPSKKIPTKYLTTTEPGESSDRKESVKTYSLAGFSFNEVEHEGSASNHIEETRTSTSVRVETPITEDTNESTTEKTTWKEYPVSISPVDKERVYVVTPQTVLETSPKEKLSKENETNVDNGNFSEFEAIEKAYQVLPQAVNNLAVASTGKENIPLWGIMEHEEFASLNADETGEGATGEGVDGPVLYSGHSKVSRAKR